MKTCKQCGIKGALLQLNADGICWNCANKIEIEKAAIIHNAAMKDAEEKKRVAREKEIEFQENISKMIVTTGDLSRPYEVIGPVYFQVSNKGIFGNDLADYVEKYKSQIETMQQQGVLSKERIDWGVLYGEWSVGQSNFDKAFYIATQELKKRGAIVGADAIICMRQDIDIDTNGFSFFYLQMYGTAVKFIN